MGRRGSLIDRVHRCRVEPGAGTKKPYAFPAYDAYDSRASEDEISDGDLLAPILLNVGLSLRSYYGLQRVRDSLAMALAEIDTDDRLSERSDDGRADRGTRQAAVRRPRHPDLRPTGVWSTKLSKILHRKRPRFLVLHDRWIRRCYWGEEEDATVKRAKTRSASDYMVAISQAIAGDLRSQRGLFAELTSTVPTAAGLSDVRIVDILAWTSQGKPSPDETKEEAGQA